MGSYALSLAGPLGALGEVRFAVADPSWRPAPSEEGTAAVLRARDAGALLELLREWRGGTAAEPAAVLVHYVGYGYQPRGCPTWLVHGLERWRAEADGCRLVTFFHEVYATGRPWQSSFWLSPVQRRLAARLARASDATATSLDLYARLLRRWRPAAAVLPAASSLGEPAAVPPLAERPPRMLVFGSAGNRLRVYRDHAEELEAACRALGIEEVADAGPPVAAPTPGPGAVPRVHLGVLPAAEMSAALLRARAGFLAYPADFLPKSSVFAAFCAHGLATLCTTSVPPVQGLEAGRHYLSPGRPPDPGALQGTADAARAWYGGHGLGRHAVALADLLRPA